VDSDEAVKRGGPVVRRATVREELPNALYRLELEDRSQVLGHVADRHKKDFLRLLPGDRVEVELSSLDHGRGRVVRKAR
jgi:translation initiation factor IF-1